MINQYSMILLLISIWFPDSRSLKFELQNSSCFNLANLENVAQDSNTVESYLQHRIQGNEYKLNEDLLSFFHELDINMVAFKFLSHWVVPWSILLTASLSEIPGSHGQRHLLWSKNQGYSRRNNVPVSLLIRDIFSLEVRPMEQVLKTWQCRGAVPRLA
jgi:hypothetical protein